MNEASVVPNAITVQILIGQLGERSGCVDSPSRIRRYRQRQADDRCSAGRDIPNVPARESAQRGQSGECAEAVRFSPA
jgi:hypothetical protein